MAIGRMLFRTESGSWGLGAKAISPGDYICILGGCEVPIVLRPEEDHFLAIGEAYLSGVMYGEYFWRWDMGELKDEIFEIR